MINLFGIIAIILIVTAMWVIFGVDMVFGSPESDLQEGKRILNGTLDDLLPKLRPLPLQGA